MLERSTGKLGHSTGKIERSTGKLEDYTGILARSRTNIIERSTG